jgi:hypothetical protein
VVREDEYDKAVQMGRTNAEAIELTRRHCRHARVELVGGNSFVGNALGLPMGLLEVRCEHAAPPRTQGHQALELAIEFYNQNCVECPFREGTGELPNLATVAADRAAEEAALQAEKQRRAEDRSRRHRQREERRRQAMGGEDRVVRDLSEHLDRLDRAELRTAGMTPDEQRSARYVVETARAAPEVFSDVLVDTVLELAADTADATALTALAELVRGGRCPPRRALDAALTALPQFRSIEAGDLVALLRPELRPGDLPEVIDQLINLASGDSDDRLRPPPASAGLRAATEVGLPLVTQRITELLASDDEWTRTFAADAANVVLAGDPTRVVALGRPLASSIRGKDAGYWGYPNPSGAALNALATAWRSEPATTRSIVEAVAAGASAEVRAELARIPWLLQRFRQPWDASTDATKEALDFLVRRVGGDWGDEAADHATDALESMARDVPAVVEQVDALVAHVLALCSPEPLPIIHPAADPMAQQVEAMEKVSRRIRRPARRRRLAKTMGRSARFDPRRVLGSILPLFTASTADADYDRTVRITMLDALEDVASPETLRDLLPIMYTALLSGDQVVRRGGIDLWAACARVADTLPDNLNDIAPALLADTYVTVHRRMLDQLPRLRLPARLAPALIQIAGGWMATYKEPHVVNDAIWAVRYLASHLENEAHATGWYGLALANVDNCGPHDRERLLTAWWPDALRTSNAWVTAALETAASAELVDYYNQRREPLLAALMDRPDLIVHVPLAQVEPLSEVHGSHHVWRALEPVELLQAAGRWADAVTVARHVEERQPPGSEGEPGRQLANAVVAHAELAQLLIESRLDAAAVGAASAAVRAAVSVVEAARGEVPSDGALRHLLDGGLGLASAADVLHTEIVADPAAAADELERAADLLAGAAQSAHASGRQRLWLGEAWRIASRLLRYDAAVRAAAESAPALFDAAKRQAEILAASMAAEPDQLITPGMSDFLDAVATISNAAEAETAWGRLAAAAAPMRLVRTSLLPSRGMFGPRAELDARPEPPLAVCVPTLSEVPVTDVLVVRPNELYTVGMMVRLLEVPEWAQMCIVEPITSLDRNTLTVPRYEFLLAEGERDESGVTLVGNGQLRCTVEQPIGDPAIDCPLVVRLLGDDQDELIEVAGCTRVRLRPFDPSRDFVTDHEQTDQRLLEMFGRLDAAEFDTEDVRAFCRLFAASVRAAQRIMFTKTFMRGTHVTEQMFHDEMERLLREDPELEGRLTRRDAVAGGFDDLLHDDVIAELKVVKNTAVTVDGSAKYLGQPTQYGIGRGSQLSVLVILDHTPKASPPGVLENYMGWLKPKLHGRDDPKYPSLVGVLIINGNLPVPSTWSRRPIEVVLESQEEDH